MTNQEIIRNLQQLIDEAVETMNGDIPVIEKRAYKELITAIRELDTNNIGNIKPSAKNLKAINTLTNLFRRELFKEGYISSIKEFVSTFKKVSKLNNEYASNFIRDFSPSTALSEIRNISVELTTQGLTEQGLESNILGPIKDILLVNIGSGASYAELVSQLTAILQPADTAGKLESYVRQITTDSINQFSRNYNQLATAAVNTDWYQYTGSNLTTTRDFCLALTKKKYFNELEIPDLIAGDFEEFREIGGKIYSKTGLPEGMIAGTNAGNFLTNAGGYNCGHRSYKVPVSVVPKEVIIKFKNRYQ